jgi:pimeloyl-ACP methyl ester carboxylesterase
MTALPGATGRRAETRARQPGEQGFIERKGVRVFYEVYGEGEPAILLLPTSVVRSGCWKMQIGYLSRDARVITFDPRGNGRSDRPAAPEAYDEVEFAADGLAVLEATGTARAFVVGWSVGAHRALVLATEHPERVLVGKGQPPLLAAGLPGLPGVLLRLGVS